MANRSIRWLGVVVVMAAVYLGVWSAGSVRGQSAQNVSAIPISVVDYQPREPSFADSPVMTSQISPALSYIAIPVAQDCDIWKCHTETLGQAMTLTVRTQYWRSTLLKFEVGQYILQGSDIVSAAIKLKVLSFIPERPEQTELMVDGYEIYKDWDELAANGYMRTQTDSWCDDTECHKDQNPLRVDDCEACGNDRLAKGIVRVGDTQLVLTDTTGRLAHTIATWLDNPNSNYGIVLNNSDGGACQVSFASRDYRMGDVCISPTLEVWYTPPVCTQIAVSADPTTVIACKPDPVTLTMTALSKFGLGLENIPITVTCSVGVLSCTAGFNCDKSGSTLVVTTTTGGIAEVNFLPNGQAHAEDTVTITAESSQCLTPTQIALPIGQEAYGFYVRDLGATITACQGFTSQVVIQDYCYNVFTQPGTITLELSPSITAPFNQNGYFYVVHPGGFSQPLFLPKVTATVHVAGKVLTHFVNNITIDPPPPAQITITRQVTDPVIGVPFTVCITVTDPCDHYPDIVEIASSDASLTVAPPSVALSANGQACIPISLLWSSSAPHPMLVPGVQIIATANGLADSTDPFTVTQLACATIAWKDNYPNQIMTSRPFTLVVQDRYGDAVDGIPVQCAGYGDQRLKPWPTIAPASATLNKGNATVTVTLPGGNLTAGTFTVTAQVGPFNSQISDMSDCNNFLATSRALRIMRPAYIAYLVSSVAKLTGTLTLENGHGYPQSVTATLWLTNTSALPALSVNVTIDLPQGVTCDQAGQIIDTFPVAGFGVVKRIWRLQVRDRCDPLSLRADIQSPYAAPSMITCDATIEMPTTYLGFEAGEEWVLTGTHVGSRWWPSIVSITASLESCIEGSQCLQLGHADCDFTGNPDGDASAYAKHRIWVCPDMQGLRFRHHLTSYEERGEEGLKVYIETREAGRPSSAPIFEVTSTHEKIDCKDNRADAGCQTSTVALPAEIAAQAQRNGGVEAWLWFELRQSNGNMNNTYAYVDGIEWLTR